MTGSPVSRKTEVNDIIDERKDAKGSAWDTKILLLDEPTSNLDVRHQLDVTKLLKELAYIKNMLVIMISHNINIAAKFSDEIIMMHDGTIYSAGNPEEVITEDNLTS